MSEPSTKPAIPRHPAAPALRPLADQVRDLTNELRYLKARATYRWAERLRRSRAWAALRMLHGGSQDLVVVEALGERHADALGQEVWLLEARPQPDADPLPWTLVDRRGTWHESPAADRPCGYCLVSEHGRAEVPFASEPVLTFLSHAWSGRAAITYRGRREIIDLYAPEGGTLTVYPAQAPMLPPGSRRGPLTGPPARGAAGGFSAGEEQFIQRVRAAQGRAVAVHVPRWLGVSNSTRALFPHTYALPPSPAVEPAIIDPAELPHHADVLLATGAQHFIFSGGDELHFLLMQELHCRDAGLRLDLLWHGGYVFFAKDYDWRVLRLWIDAARAGQVHTIGTVKAGMESFFQAAGVRSHLLLNYIAGTPEQAPDVPTDHWEIGMWMSDNQWKSPHAMLAALRMIPRARLHAAGLGPRAREVVDYFGIPVAEFHERTIPAADLAAGLRRTHLTLYVTFFECCPMLPLESFQAGIPCLIGPSSHLFEDDPYLAERLVVRYPDRAEVIARYAQRALEERHDLLAAYRAYVPRYNAAAQRSLAEFLAQ
ncbi:MAG: hypothetical protein IPM18_11850 [Phycisphaerales bacterium]|nr:hypothetical protein [Phycisphaerales bacterium]